MNSSFLNYRVIVPAKIYNKLNQLDEKSCACDLFTSSCCVLLRVISWTLYEKAHDHNNMYVLFSVLYKNLMHILLTVCIE